MKEKIRVVGTIIVERRKILCCQRGPRRALASLWEFPGRKIKNGETEVQALEHELQEELRIEVTIVREEYAFCRCKYDFSFVNLTTPIYYLEPGEPQLAEHLQIRWLTSNELNQLEWAPADILTVEKLVEKDAGTEQNG